MIFRYTILYVDDVTSSIQFYEKAFGFERLMIHESGDYGELSTGATKLGFTSKKLMSNLGKNPGMADPDSPIFEIAFETDDIKASLAKALEAGCLLVQDATDMPWGQTISYVRDQDGFLIEICSAVGPRS